MLRSLASLTACGLLAAVAGNLALVPDARAQEIDDYGDFELLLLPAESQDSVTIDVAGALGGGGRSGLEQVIDDLNMEFNLAEPVPIVFATWSDIDDMAVANLADRQPGALFDRNGTDAIYISYEFLAKILHTFEGDPDAWYLNVINVLLHEVGHALIHINRIPAPENGADPERDADEVAFFVMAAFYEAEGQLHTVAEHYRRIADAALYEGYDHLPDENRAQRYACWVWGSSDQGSPECVDLYLDLMETWDELLAPTWKDPFGEY